MGRKKESASETKAPPAPPPKEEPKEEQAEEPEDPPVVKNLKEIDDKYLELEREYEKEVQEIRKKYQEKQRPLLEERRDVLSKPAEEGKDSKTGTPALVGFWTQALQNHPAFEDQIEEWDQPVLEYLKDITTVDLTDDPSKGFKVSFHFVENPYFSNEELCVEFQSEQESPYTGDTTAKKITASEIKWKPGKDVTVEKIAKKVKGGGAKKAKQKGKTQEEPRDSIFRHFFRSLAPGMPLPDDVNLEFEDEEVDDDNQMLQMLMEHHIELGEAVKDQIIPFAVRWYTGEAAPEDDDDDDEDEESEDDEDDDDDDEDDDDDDDDEDDDDEPAPKKKGGKKPAPKAKGKGDAKDGEANKEECKQQ